jgi:hypothetical protein
VSPGSGAIKQAFKESKVKATSIDDKITRRLQEREAKVRPAHNDSIS